MAQRSENTARPRLACEITPERVMAARISERGGRLQAFASRRLAAGALTPSLASANIQDSGAIGSAVIAALSAVGGSGREVIAIIPDACVRVLLLDFETLPSKARDVEPMIRFRLRKSLPFDADQAALSYEIHSGNGTVQVMAAVMPKAVLDEYEAVFRDAGYVPGVVLPSSLATLGMIDAEQPTLLLKVESGYMTLAAANRQQLRLIRTLDNQHGSRITAAEIVDAVLPSIVFFEDTFAERIQQVYVTGIPDLPGIAALLRDQTGARVEELAPDVSDQDLSGEGLPKSCAAALAGGLWG